MGYQNTTQELQSSVEQLRVDVQTSNQRNQNLNQTVEALKANLEEKETIITILNQTNQEQAAKIETLEANVEDMNTSLGELITCMFHQFPLEDLG